MNINGLFSFIESDKSMDIHYKKNGSPENAALKKLKVLVIKSARKALGLSNEYQEEWIINGNMEDSKFVVIIFPDYSFNERFTVIIRLDFANSKDAFVIATDNPQGKFFKNLVVELLGVAE